MLNTPAYFQLASLHPCHDQLGFSYFIIMGIMRTDYVRIMYGLHTGFSHDLILDPRTHSMDDFYPSNCDTVSSSTYKDPRVGIMDVIVKLDCME